MFRFAVYVLFGSLATVASAQSVVGENATNRPTEFKDTSLLKPPAGAKVAIVVWEDLECPACAHAFPIVHAAADHYHIPLARRDFPLKMHIWSHEAAVVARYIQDKISPTGADEYRREVFASQYQIASKDDLQRFTEKFFTANHHQLPFVIDPTGQFAKEVDADELTGEKAGLNHTPTIVVVTPRHWTEVLDIAQLYSVIDAAIAETSGPGEATKAPVKKRAVPQKKS
ncbi:MAG: thioredoxin domain-containing protein [Acidobacteriaceae bacterium]